MLGFSLSSLTRKGMLYRKGRRRRSFLFFHFLFLEGEGGGKNITSVFVQKRKRNILWLKVLYLKHSFCRLWSSFIAAKEEETRKECVALICSLDVIYIYSFLHDYYRHSALLLVFHRTLPLLQVKLQVSISHPTALMVSIKGLQLLFIHWFAPSSPYIA